LAVSGFDMSNELAAPGGLNERCHAHLDAEFTKEVRSDISRTCVLPYYYQAKGSDALQSRQKN
jgi:hypothetical protein